MMLEGNRFIGGAYHIYMGASSVDVEYSALVCNHNYSRVCISVSYLSCIHFCSYYLSLQSKSLRRRKNTVITTLHSEKASYSWLASVGVFKTYSRNFGVKLII